MPWRIHMLVLTVPLMFWFCWTSWSISQAFIVGDAVLPLTGTEINTEIGVGRLRANAQRTHGIIEWNVTITSDSGDILHAGQYSVDLDWRAGTSLIGLAHMDTDFERELIVVTARPEAGMVGIIIDVSEPSVQTRDFADAPAPLKASVEHWANANHPSKIVLGLMAIATVLYALSYVALAIVIALGKKRTRRITPAQSPAYAPQTLPAGTNPFLHGHTP
ncbi:MAG: hypothetical protein ACI8PT_001501 [Gammaproteobacteria bacterium]|jgi:hypothetical protein